MTMIQAPPIEELTTSLQDNKKHLLLAASGSVATINIESHSIKLPNIIQGLSAHRHLSIRVLLTPSAARFLEGQSPEQPSLAALAALPNVDGVYRDTDEWRAPWKRGNAILHIELRRWADILVIAPLSANTLAKIVGGMADGILTSVVRAWDARGELDSDVVALREDATGTSPGGGGASGEAEVGVGEVAVARGGGRRRTKKKRIVVAPAMNTAMWRHPITAKQIRVLEKEWGIDDGNNNNNNHTTTTTRSGRDRDRSGAEDAATDDETQPSHDNTDTGSIHGGNNNDDDDNDNGYGGAGWFEVLRPMTKLLACGDRGDGAMCEWTEIVRVIEDRLELN